ncbi:NAD(P)/FAD-dependent oxidoreductase [Bradyrhizobium prioriisuperbiae]|uniref:NAD(P)/FAD-dependent oxidoreductase n=1 Tax=Bradyrhizobium prioriisuperbiae TaxID=2854389 RepID=UPI0028E1D3AE|nr:FAD-dependent oxidoreductase [Bradyrhizobium prioritasuperba]
MSGVVIIGGGQAAVQLAASLRENGYGERVTIAAAEAAPPYQRPPLSKAFLKGEVSSANLLLRADNFYTGNVIDLRLGDKATAIDRRGRKVQLASGRSLPYAHVVLATGSRNRRLDVPGSDLDGIFYLRSLADAETIKARLGGLTQVVVIGGGFVGLELACVMRDLGASVVVLEAADRPMGRAISQKMSHHLMEAHAGSGLDFLLGAKIARFSGASGRVAGIETADGVTIPADMVLVGIGADAEMGLARDCGLAVSNGIHVDDHLSTTDPAVHAIGDCALFENPVAGRRLRLESVQNAVDQARCLAATLSGRPQAYRNVPWFWSDQGDRRLQIAGLTEGHDSSIVRGDVARGRFSIFCYAGERLLGVESINQASDHMIARRLLASRVTLAPEQAADASFDLKALAVAAEKIPANA